MQQYVDSWRPDRPTRMSRPFETKGLAALTRRPRQVANLVLRGFSNGEIAERLGISVNTVKAHVHAMYKKLNVHNRTKLAIALMKRQQVKMQGARSEAVA